MKKFFTLIFTLCVLVVSANAQEYDYCHISGGMSVRGDIREIKVSDIDNMSIYISASERRFETVPNITIKGKNNISSFKKDILNLKNKYIEYVNIAKSNNITEINKEIKFNFDTPIYFRWYKGKYYEKIIPVETLFWVYESPNSFDEGTHIVYKMILKIGTNFENKYIWWDFCFSKEEHFDEFIEVLDTDKIDEFIRIQKNKENLFN